MVYISFNVQFYFHCLSALSRIGYNVLALGAVADLKVQNCQPALMPNKSTALDLTTSPAIEPNACYQLAIFCFCFSYYSIFLMFKRLVKTLNLSYEILGKFCLIASVISTPLKSKNDLIVLYSSCW